MISRTDMPTIHSQDTRASKRHANIYMILVHIYTYIHIYVRTYMHTLTHTYIHAYMHTSIHTYMHTNIHTYIHTQKHTHIHTYTERDPKLHQSHTRMWQVHRGPGTCA